MKATGTVGGVFCGRWRLLGKFPISVGFIPEYRRLYFPRQWEKVWIQHHANALNLTKAIGVNFHAAPGRDELCLPPIRAMFRCGECNPRLPGHGIVSIANGPKCFMTNRIRPWTIKHICPLKTQRNGIGMGLADFRGMIFLKEGLKWKSKPRLRTFPKKFVP